MSASTPSSEPSLAKGIAAGAVAGLVGIVAKTLAERMFAQRAATDPKPLVQRPQKTTLVTGDRIPWTFGAATGAAYGALTEYYPAASAKEGAAFGMALETLTHESPLPALGIALPIGSQTMRERAGEMTSHVVYGLTVEFVRRIVRKIL